jgi:nucleoside-diphosphate-sugar epimerase
MQVHILGSGPITKTLFKKLVPDHDVKIYSELRPGRKNNLESLSYETFISSGIRDADLILMGWKKIPALGDLKFEVLEFLKSAINPQSTLINLSSVAVYGETQKPAHEEQLETPINEYGHQKKALEKNLDDNFDSKVCHLRISNVYGSAEFSDVVNKLAESVKFGNRIELFNPDEIERDYISLNDVIRFIESFMHRQNSLPFRSKFNVASGLSTKLTDLRRMVERISSKKVLFDIKEPPLGIIHKSRIDNSKAEVFLNSRTIPSLDKLELYVNELIRNT